MARPISPTPKLDKKSSEYFLKRIESDLKKPIGAVATPRLENAVTMIMADAHRNKE
jgi:hypothetical protein